MAAGIDAIVEDACKAYYASKMRAPSLPLGRYFCMHMFGYWDGLNSERGITGVVRTHIGFANF